MLLLGCFLAVTTTMMTTTTTTTTTAQELPSSSSSQTTQVHCGGDLNPTVAGIICEPEFDFVYGTLCTALHSPRLDFLYQTLNDPAALITVWAPDNQAFDNLNDVLFGLTTTDAGGGDPTDTETETTVVDFLFSPAGQSMLTNVLLHHVAEGYLHSDELMCDEPVTTLFGTSTTHCDSITGPIFQVRGTTYV